MRADQVHTEVRILGEKMAGEIRTLTAANTTLTLLIDTTNQKVKEVEGLAKEIRDDVESDRREYDEKLNKLSSQLALLQQDYERDRKDRERLSGRVWGLVPVLVGALAGSSCTTIAGVLLWYFGIRR